MNLRSLLLVFCTAFVVLQVGGQTVEWGALQILTSSDFKSCACGNDTLIAAGGSSSVPKCYYSTDGGISWTQKVHSDVAFTSLYFDGQFFVGHDPYNFSVLSEAMAVLQGDYEYGLSAESITSGNGIYLAAGGTYDGVRISSNGLNWTEYQTDWDGNYNTLAFGDGLFLWTNSKGLHTSEDGTNWTTRIDESLTRTPVAYGNGLYVCPDESVVYSSTDGTNWVSNTLSIDPIRRLVYGDGVFFAYSENNSWDTGKVYTSTNGLSWTEQAATNMVDVVTAMDYRSGRLLLVGKDGEVMVGTVSLPGPKSVPITFCGMAGDMLHLQWGCSNAPCTLMGCASLTDADWQPVAVFSNGVCEIPVDGSNRFFRDESD